MHLLRIQNINVDSRRSISTEKVFDEDFYQGLFLSYSAVLTHWLKYKHESCLYLVFGDISEESPD